MDDVLSIYEKIKLLPEKDQIFLYNELNKILNVSSYAEGKIVYDSLVKHVRNQRHLPLNVFMKGKLLGKFVAFTETMSNLSKELKSPDFSLFSDVAVACVADRLTEMNIPVTMATILNQKDYIKISLDQAYPGYIKSGLMNVVFKGGVIGKRNK